MSGAGTADFFYREAQRLGYVARSAFKLLQIQKQHKLINHGSSVLDLGCAPGAWLQVACQSLGPLKNGGSVVGIDIKVLWLIMFTGAEQKVKVPSTHCDVRVKTICANAMNLHMDELKALSPKKKGFSVILSDMCPLVSGITTRDSALSVELGMQALNLAVGSSSSLDSSIIIDQTETKNSDDSHSLPVSATNGGGVLLPGGHLVIKFLESEDIKEFGILCKPLFRKASWLRPKATRSCSREIYLICQGLR